MTRPADIPDWAWDEESPIAGDAVELHTVQEIGDLQETIARALLEAHQRGRRDGMEEAAKVADAGVVARLAISTRRRWIGDTTRY